MIAVDLQALQSAVHGDRGIGRYVFDLTRAVERSHPSAVDVYLWNDRLPYAPALDALELGERLVPYSGIAGEAIDLVHVNSVFEPLHSADFTVPVEARRLLVTCFDLIPYRFADHYLGDPSVAARYRSRLGMLVAADAIVTDSQSCADDLVELLEIDRRRITVIGGSVGEQFVRPTVPEARLLERLRTTLPTIEAGYVFVPSGADWRKNAHGAIAAFAQLPDSLRARHQLVLTCALGGPHRDWLMSIAADGGVADRVLFTGYVADDVLVALYQAAELVVFPSLYEGFGLPVLEARRCGARVICSLSSSLPEVLPGAVAWFDPWDPTAIAHRMTLALSDPTVAAELDAIRDPGFEWSATADVLAGVYARLGGRASATA